MRKHLPGNYGIRYLKNSKFKKHKNSGQKDSSFKFYNCTNIPEISNKHQ
jgi:hypothetical protein